MLRYTIPFKDNRNRHYEVRVYVEGYAGAPEELRGAPSAFVAEGTDEDFAYHPVRTSSAVLTILDNRVLSDLYSINRQNVPVKLYQGAKLMWTGYVSPEQFTQPYRPVKDYISIDCMSAMASLEDVKYTRQTSDGFITISALLRYLIASAKGGYDKVCIPHVYASSAASYAAGGTALDDITVSEDNFVSSEMTQYDVLEYICTFFAWSMYDYEGSLYFVDPDWPGDYRAYDEGLTSFTLIRPNEVNTKAIGFVGSEHTIDILPGYNKCKVKSINNVFEYVVDDEDFKKLNKIGSLRIQEGLRYDYKEFLQNDKWEVYSYDRNKAILKDVKNKEINDNVFGAVLMREALFEGKNEGGTIKPDVIDYPWTDCVQMRCVAPDGTVVFGSADIGKHPVIKYKGRTAMWKDGALGISYSLMMRIRRDMCAVDTVKGDINLAVQLTCSLRIGRKYWNGHAWQFGAATFTVESKYEGEDFRGWTNAVNTKTPDMPYRGLNGYVVELPTGGEQINGDLEFVVYNLYGSIGSFGPVRISNYGYVMKDLKLTYKKRDDVHDEGEDGDRVYENVVNGAFLSDMDEVDFGIGSYNSDGATYSKALMGGRFLTDNLYSAVEGKTVRPEEAYIRRVVKRYRTTHVKLTQTIKNSLDVHPFTRVSDSSMVNRVFAVSTWSRDYERNTLTLLMIDNDR